ncbi:hypothetical protein ITJ66_09780 [Plantibacter sp. VKM Ac-2885]|jgi:hypothetical protein|uniref:hypothetical protein n=1 Tax=Plantibacter TaxID=190323 RepID=UPI0007D8D002|nr:MULTISPECIES: hypothetical protein [Plantibacter]AQX80062.1 hypothetical protein BWO91_08755 [Plantibacter flavus]MBD8102697.1 hypothetical protein [Plantibacter sp. CFBP 8775]MBD8515794.1 hypothetical protein [Plantibacter sp. CFBP 8804]MBD8536213.1 hypothetical protein [Plantibacter sp. CFBP 13570]MBF4512773.1 hypothetical protein [Plantibacter sp. VKM Ac-2885]
MSIAASVLATAVLAESEHAVELAAPTWVFGAVALVLFAILGAVTFSYRDVANRHADKGESASAHGEHGH